jgi:hypothetical protein
MNHHQVYISVQYRITEFMRSTSWWGEKKNGIYVSVEQKICLVEFCQFSTGVQYLPLFGVQVYETKLLKILKH